ncbi:4'-phosphopantetheinyl transferase family protein [Aquimarina sp. 433]
MIGNDIVDLALATTQSNWRRKGWLQKIFTISEQDRIWDALDPDLAVWELWSMKEATYKAYQRQFLKAPIYNPWDFECSETSVIVKGMQYKTKTTRTSEYIHSVAFIHPKVINAKVFTNESLTYKKHLLDYISKTKGLNSEKITIKKNDFRIPLVYINNLQSDIKVSFSSHGLFSSYAVDL